MRTLLAFILIMGICQGANAQVFGTVQEIITRDANDIGLSPFKDPTIWRDKSRVRLYRELEKSRIMKEVWENRSAIQSTKYAMIDRARARNRMDPYKSYRARNEQRY